MRYNTRASALLAMDKERKQQRAGRDALLRLPVEFPEPWSLIAEVRYDHVACSLDSVHRFGAWLKTFGDVTESLPESIDHWRDVKEYLEVVAQDDPPPEYIVRQGWPVFDFLIARTNLEHLAPEAK